VDKVLGVTLRTALLLLRRAFAVWLGGGAYVAVRPLACPPAPPPPALNKGGGIKVYVIHYSKATSRRGRMEATLRAAGVDPNSTAVGGTRETSPCLQPRTTPIPALS
jgi:hypothetical protein